MDLDCQNPQFKMLLKYKVLVYHDGILIDAVYIKEEDRIRRLYKEMAANNNTSWIIMKFVDGAWVANKELDENN